MAESTSEIG